MTETLQLVHDNIDLEPMIDDWIEEEKHEECGVIGLWLAEPTDQIAELVRSGLEEVQHRGEEAAGCAVGNGNGGIEVLKDVGLVTTVMGGNNLAGLPPGRYALGHVRYGTIGVKSQKDSWRAAGPTYEESSFGPISVTHNGNVLNVESICEEFGVNTEEHVTDSSALTACVAAVRESVSSLPEAVVKVFSSVKEAFTIIVMGEGQLICVRDPHGFRPAMLGTFKDNGGYAFASETPALKSMGADFRREISRGEMLVCNPDGSLTSSFPFEEKPSKLCAFEFIYFTAPHAKLEGRGVHMVRKEMGRILAHEQPVKADAITGVPDSGLPGAEGYAQASGTPLVTAFAKSRYQGRSFITPGQSAREAKVKRKLHVIEEEVYGKELVVVDDSVIRGTTTKAVVKMLRDAGALKIHLRITSAPYKWPCFYGMDTPDPEELIANLFPLLHDLEQELGVNSLGYLSLAGIRAATSDAGGRLCMACMDGNYATKIPVKKRAA